MGLREANADATHGLAELPPPKNAADPTAIGASVPSSSDALPIVKTWQPGEVIVQTIEKGPKGVGMKLDEREGGVYVTKTTRGSPSEQAIGSTEFLGPRGLRILKVQGQVPRTKADCVSLIKGSQGAVEIEFVLEPIPDAAAPTTSKDRVDIEATPSTPQREETKASTPALIVRRYKYNKVYTKTIRKGDIGLGVKLHDRNGGVYITRTTVGSPAEDVLGSTKYLGPTGLRLIKVAGEEVASKKEAMARIKGAAPGTDVSVDVVIEPGTVKKQKAPN
jgi:hypothetical protein